VARLRELLDRRDLNGKPIRDGKQAADLVSETILKGALNGDFRFVQFLVDRTEHSEEIDAIWAKLESLDGPGPDLERDQPARVDPGPVGPVEPGPV